jgi:hypothetical protein
VRNFGVFLLILGIAGFLISASQLSRLDPLPEGLSLRQSLDHAAGRWQLARYASVGVGAFGLLMTVFPKGR